MSSDTMTRNGNARTLDDPAGGAKDRTALSRAQRRIRQLKWVVVGLIL